MEALKELERRSQNLEDSKSHQNFQIQDPYSIFQVPQQEEHTDLEKSTKSMIQFQSDPFNMIEARLSRLENTYRNKETLPTQSLTIPSTSTRIDENQKSWNLEDFDQLISLQNLELDQYQPIDKLTSFHFNEIELEYECEPDLPICGSIPIFESMLTPASLPKLDPLPEPTLIFVSMDFEIEPFLLDSHISLM